MTEPMVRIRGVSKSYGTREVLHGIDLDVMPGSVMCIIGPSGLRQEHAAILRQSP